MTKPTLIAFVLDQSGSMASVHEATIAAFNTFLAEQRKEAGRAVLSLTLFDTSTDARFVAKDLADVPALGDPSNAYRPSGGTALLDAMGVTIKGAEGWLAKQPEEWQVIVVALTDGEENSSREWHMNQPPKEGDDKDLGGLIRWKQDEGWQFIFLGSGGSAWLERTFGHVVDQAHFSSFAHNAGATMDSYAGVTRTVAAYRGTGHADVSHLVRDKK
jgi:hypothetical protein